MIVETCTVLKNKQRAENIWQMELSAPGIAAQYKGAGQFINILANRDWSHPLRRPMSIAAVKGSTVTIIYRVFGAVTKILATKIKQDIIDVLGPLGNTFSGWESADPPVLVGGGVGLAPILNLYHECLAKSVKPVLIIGAKTAAEHFLKHDPGNQVFLTTDDGTLGNPGTVIPTMNEIADSLTAPVIYTCGPVPMMKAVQEFANRKGIPAQLAVESYMGCGIGLCQGCVIKRKKSTRNRHSYQEQYSLVCKEGPIYSANEVIID